MKIYCSPLACSLATRIALYEAGADAEFVAVDLKAKMTLDGRDFRTIYPLSLVPALEIAPGQLLSESAAVLQYVAALYPTANLGAEGNDAWGRAELAQWLSFIGTELHQGLYLPQLDKTAPPEAKRHALGRAASRLGWVAQRLTGREFLLDHFTVADAYLFAILNWSSVTPIDLRPWPVIGAYQAALARRPHVARALSEETNLYRRAA